MGLSKIIAKLNQRRKTTSPLSMTRLFRWAVIIISFFVVFSLLDLLSQKFQLYPGVVAWYPPDGVAFAFLTTLGPWFTPFVALASIISSMVIYKFAAPILPIVVWALILSTSYGVVAIFIRRYRTKTAKLLSVRSLLVWLVFGFIAVTLLSILSVSNLVQFGLVPKTDAFNATIQWWIGEMIGLLAFTPFLLLYVMPWIIRFGQGKRLFPRRAQKIKLDIGGMVRAISMCVILYLVFGNPKLQQIHLHFLIAVPLIWVAMKHGFARTSLAILLTNFGVMVAVWIFKYQHVQMGEYQFLMFGIYLSALIIGIIVSKQKESEEELRKKEIHNRTMIENAPDGIILLAADGNIKYRSPSTERLLGYNQELHAGTNPSLLTHPDDARQLTRLYADLVKNPGKVMTHQYRIKHEDGSWHWLESTFTNQLSNPALEAVVVNFRDITERKQAEEALTRSEQRFRALVEQSQEEISLLTAEGILTYESPNTRRPLGYAPDDLIGKTIFDIFHPDEFETVTQLFIRVAQEPGRVEKARFRVRHKNGSYRWMEGYISNMLEEPAVHSIVVNYSDITDQVAIEQEILVLAKIPSESPNPVLRMNQEGALLYANEASNDIQELWDVSVGSTVPKYMLDIALVALARQENIAVEIKCEDKVFSVTVTPIIETGYINLYGRDITKRVRAEEKLKESNEELSMLFELSHSLAEAESIGHIFDIVNRHAVESMHNTFARIALLENDCFVMKAGFPSREVNKNFRLGESVPVSSLPFSQRMLHENEIKVIHFEDPEIGDEEKSILFINEAKCICLVPLRTSDSSIQAETMVGLLMLGESCTSGIEPFSPEKMRLVQTIGDSAATAIRRMLLRDQTEQRMRQLIALSEIDLAIISNSDIKDRLKIVCRQILEQLKVDAVDLWIYDSSIDKLTFSSSQGFNHIAFENANPVSLDEGMLGQAFLKRQTIHISNITLENKNPRFAKALEKEPFMGYYAVPLITNNEAKGVLEIFNRTELEGNAEWMKFLQTLANQAAIAIDNSMLFNDLKQSNNELVQAYDATIQGWSRALDLRDNETEGHTQRVTELTMRLARMFGLPEEELIHVRRGALLHDIGKMGVPDRILLKPGPLTDEEWVTMRKHTSFAYDLLSPIAFLKPALDIPMYHHEKWDGTGYPHGLAGDKIPFAARIFSVVDVWDALTSDRPYREAWPEEKVLGYIRSLSGTQFDPQVVNVSLEPGFLTGIPREREALAMVQWSDRFSVGSKEMDSQHQKLVGMLNRLVSVTNTDQVHSETVISILEEMSKYAQVHFIAEERLMATHGFEGLKNHKLQHLWFQARVKEFTVSLGKDGKKAADELLEFLKGWWVKHILEEDMACKDLFIEKGLD